jgi:hypothetical protein
MAGDASAVGAADPAPSAPDPISSIEAQAKLYSDATDQVRKRADLTAKALGGIGTTALTAVGLSKFSDIYPWPPGQAVALVAVIAGFAAMAVVVILFTTRLWSANSPIFMTLDLSEMDQSGDLAPRETSRVQRVYDAMAARNNVKSPRVYEARASALQRIAMATEDAERRAELAQQALLMQAEVRATLARAAVNVVRQRAKDAVIGKTPYLLYATFFIGLFAFGVGSDRLDSERSAKITTAKNCADALKAVGARTDLTGVIPKICTPKISSSNKDDTPATPKSGRTNTATQTTPKVGQQPHR